ncbi:uncharacterized protein EAF02_008152 [Botrytis sinoallii]|uniref:uncharacterized protein n=1 Tax=Botrytis sinoallii TaxID=1463999 RepID=UPI0019026915|nr:uncharacterized protein EAF02_008152 [Botrytis sinoallii]KAF7876932.1 hypothetical protein EAF02_008152 [Botrytis sinoallii]
MSSKKYRFTKGIQRWCSSERWRPDGKSPIFVRKDTVIITPLYSPHRLANCFQPDGDKFIPLSHFHVTHPIINVLSPFARHPLPLPKLINNPSSPAVKTHLSIQEQPTYLLDGNSYMSRPAPRRNRNRIHISTYYLECRDEVEEWVEELPVSTSSRNGVKVALIAE